MQYLPFGGIFVEQKDIGLSVPYLFNAKEYDEESGFYNYLSRYQSPEFGIFLSVDGLSDKFAYSSPYCYTLGNPLKYTDPTGMSPEWIDNGDGTYTAEAGDSAYSLAKDAGILNETANALVVDQHGSNYVGNSGVLQSNIHVGDVVRVSNSKEEVVSQESGSQNCDVCVSDIPLATAAGLSSAATGLIDFNLKYSLRPGDAASGKILQNSFVGINLFIGYDTYSSIREAKLNGSIDSKTANMLHVNNVISTLTPPQISVPLTIGTTWGAQPKNADKIEKLATKFTNKVMYPLLQKKD